MDLRAKRRRKDKRREPESQAEMAERVFEDEQKDRFSFEEEPETTKNPGS
mgnify:CR=1 FL=1